MREQVLNVVCHTAELCNQLRSGHAVCGALSEDVVNRLGYAVLAMWAVGGVVRDVYMV